MSALKIIVPVLILAAGAASGGYYAYTQGLLDPYLPPSLASAPPPPLRPTMSPDETAWDGVDKSSAEAVRAFLATPRSARLQAEGAAVLVRLEAEAFAGAADVDDAQSYEAYLAQFPEGANAENARMRLTELAALTPADGAAPAATAPAAAAPAAKPPVTTPAPPKPAAPKPPTPAAAKPATPTAPPPGAAPSRVENGYIIGAPWLERPTGEDLDDAYPPFALNLDMSGQAQLDCLVLSTGNLKCDIMGETPPGRSFGGAGIAAAKKFRMAQRLANGTPTAGLRTRLQISFKPPPKGAGTF